MNLKLVKHFQRSQPTGTTFLNPAIQAEKLVEISVITRIKRDRTIKLTGDALNLEYGVQINILAPE